MSASTYPPATVNPTGAAGGDLSGLYPNPTVATMAGGHAIADKTAAGSQQFTGLVGGNAGMFVPTTLSYFLNAGGTTGMKEASAGRIQFTCTGMGFNGAAPVAQPAAPTQPANTASTNVTPFGYATAAQADAVVAAVRSLIAIMSVALGGNGITA